MIGQNSEREISYRLKIHKKDNTFHSARVKMTHLQHRGKYLSYKYIVPDCYILVVIRVASAGLIAKQREVTKQAALKQASTQGTQSCGGG